MNALIARARRHNSRMLLNSTCALLVAGIASFSSPALAEGTTREALTTNALRVCADPSNMPYSNDKFEGFENKIVDLIAKKLERKVHYTWYPQTIGFVRNTLRVRECDLISGITTTSSLVQNTNPYYHSIYTMVYRKDSGITAVAMNDPQLKDKKLGVVAGTPPATIIARLGLLRNVKPYHLVADTRRDKPVFEAISDVAAGTTDVAFIWGPLAAYHARETGEDLVIVPLENEEQIIRLNFTVSMAVRYGENDWKQRINTILEDLKPQIDEILSDFNVPLVDTKGHSQ